MCKSPEIIAEVTELPLRRFHLDAAILFSDILITVDAYRVGLHFDEGIGPVIDTPLKDQKDVDALPLIDIPEALKFVSDGIRLIKSRIKVPLIGFCGAPFTVASYLIEGKSTRDFRKTKQWMFRCPASFHALLSRLADDAIAYLRAQVEAGVEAVQIFDTWAGCLGNQQFREFSLQYLEKIVKAIKVPVIFFCRGAFAREIVKAAPQAISVDWTLDLKSLRSFVPPSIALQGNLDPDFLYAPPSALKAEVIRLLKAMKGDPGYIFNLGHGIAPDVPVDSVKLLVDTVVEGVS